MIYYVTVHFWSKNKFYQYEWDNIYRLTFRPSMAWMRKLNDGINEPQYYRVLHKMKEPKDGLNPSYRE